MNITTIELPIYNLDIVVIIDESWDVANKKFKLELTEDYLTSHAITYPHPEYKDKYEIFLLLKPKYLDHNTLAHELMHVIMNICALKGIVPDTDNDEPLAYLQGYISEEIYKFKDKYLSKSLEVKIK